jgi:hypothetical protein
MSIGELGRAGVARPLSTLRNAFLRALHYLRDLRPRQAAGTLVPRTLFGRATLAIMVPTLVLQIFVTWLFYDILWDNVTRRMARSLVGDINLVIAAHEQFGPDDARFQWLLDRAEIDFRGAMTFTKGEKIPAWPGPASASLPACSISTCSGPTSSTPSRRRRR